MTYTKHGHHIPGTTLDGERPMAVKRCGGMRLCPECKMDAEIHAERTFGEPVDLIAKAKIIVLKYVDDRLDKTRGDDTMPPYEIFVVWFAKTLGNWKALLGTTLPDNMYYELTYNGEKRETYIDAYSRLENVVIPD